LNGTVTDASSTAPLSGAAVTLSNGASTSTNGSGFYQFSSVAPGSYGVTASKTGYVTGTASNVGVTAGSTTTQNFALTQVPAQPPGTLQGTVTDASAHLAVSGATVTLSTGTSATTDTSGFYQFGSVAAGTYNVTVAKAGYNSSTANGVVVSSGATTTQDFALTAPAPTITGFTPNRGKVGTVVTITGTNFLTARAVVFNATAATQFTVNSATQITATVPAGATTGRIKVTTSGGTVTSGGPFRVR
jgi:Carboxypeptidase regulatory-like domain